MWREGRSDVEGGGGVMWREGRSDVEGGGGVMWRERGRREGREGEE